MQRLFRVMISLVVLALVSVSGMISAVSATLVINEIDYDQPSTDTAEFLELKNVSGSTINLDNYTVELINGSLGGAVLYKAIDLPNVDLAAGDYYVICANAATVPNCDLDSTPDTDFIQNGAPDALGLKLSGALVDAVSYEGNSGAPYTEGSGTGLEDNPALVASGTSRCPDGTDTDANNLDFLPSPITPGAASNCPPPPPVVEIWQIQGAAHLSPYSGQLVRTSDNIVTAVATNGFWIQTPDARVDADAATSNGVFVFTGGPPTVAVGNQVDVRGTVAEFRPGGAASANLTTTELSGPLVTVDSVGNPLPAVTIIGLGGRIPPTAVINDDGSGNVETGGTFDTATDGIDFYESLEGMRVQVNGGRVVGPTSPFNETWVVADNGANATPFTARGGVLITPGDFNPERIQLDDTLYPGGAAAWPDLNIGDSLTSPALGVVDYNFGNFEVLVTQTYTTASGGLARETAGLIGSERQLTVATFNVENLAGNAAPGDFSARAVQIVNHLGSPDIVVLEEIQDNTGATDDGVTDASVTLTNLVNAITAAGGPAYQFAQIDPVNDADGGQPGGNIRVGFLYNPARVTFVSHPGATSTTANSAVCVSGSLELAFSPGRIDPANAAFTASRKPLAGEFIFNGERLFVIGLHFSSKGGDDPLFGFRQPPVLVSEVQRLQQAQVVNNFVDAMLACDPSASIVVLGDVNDFDFSAVAGVLSGGVLSNLMSTLPANERYSYVFEGNSQVLDQILTSQHVFGNLVGYDVVHINSEFAAQVSDHDPSVMLARFNSAPTAVDDAYPTNEDTALTVPAPSVLGNDIDVNGDALTAAFLNTTTHGTLNFSADGSFTYTPLANFFGTDAFTYQISDGLLASNIATVTITVNAVNDAPSVANPGDQTNNEGDSVSLPISATDPDDTVLRFTADILPTGLAIDPLTGHISGVIDYTAAQNIPYVVTVSAIDGQGASGSATFNWTVNNVNRPPTITAPTDQVNIEGDPVSLAVAASDPDGDPLIFSASGLPGGLSIDPTTGLITGNIAPSASLTPLYSVTVTATDPGGLPASASFSWTVNPVPVAIDIKPGETPNCFNSNGRGSIPVAVLGSASFDVSQIDPATIELQGQGVRSVGKGGNLQAHIEDVNGDGFGDLVVQIEDAVGAFPAGDSIATLKATLVDGTRIAGSDTVCIVP